MASQVTALEVWLLACILLVFGALAEYAFILRQIIRLSRQCKKERDEFLNTPTPPAVGSPAMENGAGNGGRASALGAEQVRHFFGPSCLPSVPVIWSVKYLHLNILFLQIKLTWLLTLLYFQYSAGPTPLGPRRAVVTQVPVQQGGGIAFKLNGGLDAMQQQQNSGNQEEFLQVLQTHQSHVCYSNGQQPPGTSTTGTNREERIPMLPLTAATAVNPDSQSTTNSQAGRRQNHISILQPCTYFVILLLFLRELFLKSSYNFFSISESFIT